MSSAIYIFIGGIILLFLICYLFFSNSLSMKEGLESGVCGCICPLNGGQSKDSSRCLPKSNTGQGRVPNKIVTSYNSGMNCGSCTSRTQTKEDCESVSYCYWGIPGDQIADSCPTACQDANANPCSSNPCGDNGACTISGESFSCACTNGYTGSLCALPPASINPIPINPLPTPTNPIPINPLPTPTNPIPINPLPTPTNPIPINPLPTPTNPVCNPSCINFTGCGAGTYLTDNLSACSGTSCTAAECCLPNPTCDSIKSCPSGRQFKSNYEQINCKGKSCEDTECCDPASQPTCTAFPCPINFSLQKNAEDIDCGGEACTDSECCVASPLPTCFGNKITCPANYFLSKDAQNIQCSDYTCTVNECCSLNPTCGSIQCKTGYTTKSTSTVCKGSVCTQSECCTPNPSCLNFACDDGFSLQSNPDKIICNSAKCKNSDCCLPDTPPCPPSGRETIIIFNQNKDDIENGASDSNANSDIYQYSDYDNWTSPQQAISYQTNNMFSEVPPATGDPFSFNITNYNQT